MRQGGERPVVASKTDEHSRDLGGPGDALRRNGFELRQQVPGTVRLAAARAGVAEPPEDRHATPRIRGLLELACALIMSTLARQRDPERPPLHHAPGVEIKRLPSVALGIRIPASEDRHVSRVRDGEGRQRIQLDGALHGGLRAPVVADRGLQPGIEEMGIGRPGLQIQRAPKRPFGLNRVPIIEGGDVTEPAIRIRQ